MRDIERRIRELEETVGVKEEIKALICDFGECGKTELYLRGERYIGQRNFSADGQLEAEYGDCPEQEEVVERQVVIQWQTEEDEGGASNAEY